MIVQITGTYGSGKSTVVQSFMSRYKKNVVLPKIKVPDRTVSSGHVLDDKVYIVGGYLEDRMTSGADTIKYLDYIFEHVKNHHALGRHVVMEGIFLMSMKRIPYLAREIPLQILQLTTSLETSFIGISERRAAVGEKQSVNRKNVESHYRTSQSFCSKMRFLGIPVHRVTRDSALLKLVELIGETS